MTRKDYVAIAAALKESRSISKGNEALNLNAANFNCGISEAARRIADVMARDNPRFDRARFLAACGVQS